MAPEFCVEITSKTIYGPVTYPNASDLKEALVAGTLKLDSLMIDEDSPFSLKVKEVKEPK